MSYNSHFTLIYFISATEGRTHLKFFNDVFKTLSSGDKSDDTKRMSNINIFHMPKGNALGNNTE